MKVLDSKVILEGVNIVKKHLKPSQANPDGGIVEHEAPIHVSNVALYDSKTKKTVKVGYKVEECNHTDCPYRTEPMTNADRVRSMSDEELAEFIQNMVDGSNSHNVACYGCINYGTHHSDPANKGTYLHECEGCTNEGIGLDVLMWLRQPPKGE